MTTSPQDDLTTERAAIALLEQMGLYGHPAASQFIGDILVALQTTRQKALREAAKLVNSYNCMHNHGTRATKACDDIFEQLDRLAREGRE